MAKMNWAKARINRIRHERGSEDVDGVERKSLLERRANGFLRWAQEREAAKAKLKGRRR